MFNVLPFMYILNKTCFLRYLTSCINVLPFMYILNKTLGFYFGILHHAFTENKRKNK